MRCKRNRSVELSGRSAGCDDARLGSVTWRTMTKLTRALAARPGAGLAAAPDRGELELEDRAALRRVAGMSTELQDITEVEYRELRLEKVVLIGVWTEGALASAENSLRELSRLAETAGSQVLDGLIQRRGRPDPATYV